MIYTSSSVTHILYQQQQTLLLTITYYRDDDVLRSAIVNTSDSQSFVLFILTFVSSVLSASLGTTKCLKVGVAAPMGEEGPLDAMLSGRFVVGFIGKYFRFN